MDRTPMPSDGPDIAKRLKLARRKLVASEPDDAIDLCDQVLGLDPLAVEALHVKALALRELGQADEALRLIGQAIECDPSNPALALSLGDTLRLESRYKEALQAYRKIGEQHEINARVLLRIANTLHDMGQTEDAKGVFTELVERFPNEQDHHVLFATFLRDADGLAPAIDVLEAAAETLPKAPRVFFTLADLLEQDNQLERALAIAEQARELVGDLPAVLRVWAKIQRRLGNPAAAHEALSRIDINRLDTRLARKVHSDWAHVADLLGLADEAFEHFTAQNDCTSKLLAQTSVTKDAYLDQVSEVAEICTPTWLSGWPPIDEDQLIPIGRSSPVFIVGFPRSGTTLLDQVLDSHPDIQVLEELPVLLKVRDEIAARYDGYPQGLPRLDTEAVNELRKVYRDELIDNGCEVDRLLVINKMPLNLVHTPLIHRIFPDSRIILSLRHPLDCVLSCFMQDFYVNSAMANFLTLEDTVTLYEKAMGIWLTLEQTLSVNCSRVRYEDLIDDVRGEGERITQFIGTGWNDAQHSYLDHARGRTIKTPSYWQVTQPIYHHAAMRWHRYREHLAAYEDRVARFVGEFGYG